MDSEVSFHTDLAGLTWACKDAHDIVDLTAIHACLAKAANGLAIQTIDSETITASNCSY